MTTQKKSRGTVISRKCSCNYGCFSRRPG